MIKGIGIDSVDQDRMARIFSRYGQKFQDKILGPSEKEELKIRSHKFQKIRYLSNNFACKEAFSKVLGLGFREGVSLKEIEILRNENGKPYIHLSGNTQKIADRLEIKNINVSITDTNNLSTAFVIGE
tara:strand:- start:1330 stop:1713 length:384 start_codon:yes stop_codon:yes gene_type:complete